MPGGQQHSAVSLQAYELLNSWEKDLWKVEAEKISYFSGLPDALFAPDYKDYCAVRPEKDFPHGPTDSQWTTSIFRADYDRGPTKYMLESYIKRMASAVSDKDFEAFTAFADYIADSCHPSHLVNNSLIYKLFPPPRGRYWQIHRMLDSISINQTFPEGIMPVLLGLDVEEIVFHAVNKYEKMVEWGISKLAPALDAVYSGDEKKAEMHVDSCYKKAVSLLCSIWHSVFCTSCNRFSSNEKDALREVKLNKLNPLTAFTVDPYFFYPLFDNDCDSNGNLDTPESESRRSRKSSGKNIQRRHCYEFRACCL